MRAQPFFEWLHVFFGKQVVHAYFFEFGESSEILQTHFPSFLKKQQNF